MALAHTVGDKVDAAYRRGDGFEKRVLLAEECAKYCGEVEPGPAGAEVAAKSLRCGGSATRRRDIPATFAGWTPWSQLNVRPLSGARPRSAKRHGIRAEDQRQIQPAAATAEAARTPHLRERDLIFPMRGTARGGLCLLPPCLLQSLIRGRSSRSPRSRGTERAAHLPDRQSGWHRPGRRRDLAPRHNRRRKHTHLART
jgi:hypothetical protein